MRLRAQFGIQLLGGLANTALLILLTPLLVDTLGLERYGVLLLVLSFTIYAGLADLGIGPATSQRIASAPQAHRSEIFGVALVLGCVFGSLAGAIFALLSLPCVGTLVHVTPAVAKELSNAGWALFGVGCSSVISGVPNGALLGISRFIDLNIVSLTGTALGIVAPVLYAVTVGPDLVGLIAAVAVARFVTSAVALALCLKAGLQPRFWPLRRSVARPLIGYGGWSTAIAVVHRATNSIDRPLIGALGGASLIPLLAIPQGILSRTNFIVPALMSAVFPRLADHDESQSQFSIMGNCYKLILLLSPLYVAGVIATPALLTIWLGKDFSLHSSRAAVLLSISTWIDTLNYAPYVYMQASAKLRSEMAIASGILLPNLLLMVVATLFFGVTGAAFVSVIRSLGYLAGRVVVTDRFLFPWADFILHCSLLILAGMFAISFMPLWPTLIVGPVLVGASCAVTLLRLPAFAVGFLRQYLPQ